MKTYSFISLLFSLLLLSGCGDEESSQEVAQEHLDSRPTPLLNAQAVDANVTRYFMEDSSEANVSATMDSFVGNWYGKKDHMSIALQLKKDGSYRYHSVFHIGKFHNTARTSDYEGSWSLAKGDSQLLLTLQNNEAPLVITNNFPTLQTPAGVVLSPGASIERTAAVTFDKSQNIVTAEYTDRAKEYMSRSIADYQVDYFTMVAPKANTEEFWKSVDMLPPGYNFGHKLTNETTWNYAKERVQQDPKNYTIVIPDESWQTLFGNRGNYKEVILDPHKMYRWFEYFKDEMQILGKVKGSVLYIFAGDAPASWPKDVRSNFDNDPKKVPAHLYESRFPEVLERKPSNSFAGIFQMMDYLRMKYAPNVKMGYTIKTWGTPATKILFDEPQEGWENRDETKIMAEYFNNFDVQFDFLTFNFNPRSQHETEGYKSAARYFGAVSKAMQSRDGTATKLWIWKLSLWNQEQTFFVLHHIEYLVNECNAIGVTLGHGNDLSKKSGFEDNAQEENYLQSWIKEYYSAQEQNITIHSTLGKVYWR